MFDPNLEIDDFTKLENLLQQWVDPIKATPIVRGFETLRAYDRHDAWMEISKYLDHGIDAPVSDSLLYIESCLTIELDIVFNQLGIVCGGDINFKCVVLEGLHILEDINEPDAVVAITQDFTDPVMALCELLELATTVSWSEFFSHITHVPPRQIERIGSLYTGLVEDEIYGQLPVFESNDKEKAIRLTKYMDVHNHTMVVTSVMNGRPLGTPMYVLLNDHKVSLGNLEPSDPSQAALEIMGLCLLGDIPKEKFQIAVKEVPETIYTSIDFITRLNVELDRLIVEVFHG